MRSVNPFVQRKLGIREHGSNGDAVLQAAMPAEQQTRAMRLSFKAALAICAATVRADRAIRPADAFKVGAGGSLFVVMRRSVGGWSAGGVFCLIGHGVTSL